MDTSLAYCSQQCPINNPNLLTSDNSWILFSHHANCKHIQLTSLHIHDIPLTISTQHSLTLRLRGKRVGFDWVMGGPRFNKGVRPLFTGKTSKTLELGKQI